MIRFVRLSPSIHRRGNRVYFSFSPQRSGQHLVIGWLCRGLDDILHVNHVRLRRRGLVRHIEPVTGRVILYRGDAIQDFGRLERGRLPDLSGMSFGKEFWNLEDIHPADPSYRAVGGAAPERVFVILRDPANWLASTFRMGRWTVEDVERKVDVYLGTLQFCLAQRDNPACRVIRFNDFVSDAAYRKALSASLPGHDLSRSERALDEVPDFGGGSSFSGLTEKAGSGIENRWHAYAGDPDFRRLLKTPGLRTLSEAFFGRDHLQFLD